MKKVLLCPPTFYDIEYEINPWMHIENKVNRSKAKEEYAQLLATYKELGIETLEITQAQGLPDMVYAANFGSPHKNTFIVANFKYNERKGESVQAEMFFKKLGFTIRKLAEDVNFEGQGDLLTIGGKHFFGYGIRSDYSAKQYVESFLQEEVIDFELVNSWYYHLDTCFAPLSKDTVVINPDSFKREGLEKIYKYFKNIIIASPDDNKRIACNLVCVGKHVIIGKGITQQLKNDFKKFGYIVHEIPMEEYRKGGGSVKCLTLEFY